MNAGSSIQQAVDLNLFLYDRPLHPELFRHYADFRVRQGDYQVDIWLVGLAHVVTVSRGGVALTELVAPESDVLPQRGILTHFRMKGERDLEKQTEEGWNYMVSTQVEQMEDALYKSVHNDLLQHAMKRGCYVLFEQWADGSGLVPFSYIDHEARAYEFHLHAFHAFPAERTIVKTQTIFELPRDE